VPTRLVQLCSLADAENAKNVITCIGINGDAESRGDELDILLNPKYSVNNSHFCNLKLLRYCSLSYTTGGRLLVWCLADWTGAVSVRSIHHS
jgi:hypothetical protein